MDRKDGGRKKQLSFKPAELIRYYLQHVLPKCFQKIRYYSFLNNSTRRKNFEAIYSQQGGRKNTPKFDRSSPFDLIASAAWKFNSKKCPCCGCGKDAMEFVASGWGMKEMEASICMRARKFAGSSRGTGLPERRSRSSGRRLFRIWIRLFSHIESGRFLLLPDLIVSVAKKPFAQYISGHSTYPQIQALSCQIFSDRKRQHRS